MNWDSVMDSSVSRNMRFLNRRMACPSRVLPFLHRQSLVMAPASSGTYARYTDNTETK